MLAGGPGTGKTTTVSRLLALLREQHPTCRIALAAPTGKAAARLGEAVALVHRDPAAGGPARSATSPPSPCTGCSAGAPARAPDSGTTARNRLPYDVVVVDETSMVSLTMMARLLEALRPTARLVLVGDPDQLASVEAGAVLADLVDRDTLGTRTPEFAATLRALLPEASVVERAGNPLSNGVSALSTNRRFAAASDIHLLATAIRDGDGERALALLQAGSDSLELVEVAEDKQPTTDQLAGLRADIDAFGDALHRAAAVGDQAAALKALELHRVLCAHRRGPRGVRRWSALTAGWIAAAHPTEARGDGHYVGEPLLVTTNDADIGLFNGDTGVVVADGSGLIGVFGRGGDPIAVQLSRLGAVRPLHAMTIHRSQGSEFQRVTVMLALAGSPLEHPRDLVHSGDASRVLRTGDRLGGGVARVHCPGPPPRATGLRDRLR